MISRHKVAPKIKAEFLRNPEMPQYNDVDNVAIVSHEITLIDLKHLAYREDNIAKAKVQSLQELSKRTWPRPLQN